MSYEHLYTVVKVKEPHLDSANGYEILGEEFMDCCYWDEELKSEMNRAVILKGGPKDLKHFAL